MARVLELNWDTDTLDLLAAAGSGWRATSWNPSVAVARYGATSEPVTETIDAIVDSASHDALAEDMREMGKMARLANMYLRDPTTYEPVWLHAQMTSETNERRALVRSIEYTVLTPLISATGHAQKSRAQVRLTIEREPFWEATGTESLDLGELNSVGDTATYSSFPGDVRGRILQTSLTYVSGAGTLDTFWIGVRSEDKHDSDGITGFESVWDCEDGSNLTGGDCTDTADADAYGGTMVKCTFATNSGWHERIRLLASALVGVVYPDDQAGRHLMLLRCRVTSGTAEILALTGWVDDGKSYHRQTVVEVDETDYIYKEIGIIEIPLNTANGYGVEIWARQTSGSGDLYMDCIVMVPIDEAFCKIENGDLDSLITQVEVRVGDRDDSEAYRSVGGGRESVLPFSTVNWSLPPGDGMLVVAAQQSSEQDKDDDFEFSLAVYDRYLSLRGDD